MLGPIAVSFGYFHQTTNVSTPFANTKNASIIPIMEFAENLAMNNGLIHDDLLQQIYANVIKKTIQTDSYGRKRRQSNPTPSLTTDMYKQTFATYPLGRAYVPKEYHSFKKAVPFKGGVARDF